MEVLPLRSLESDQVRPGTLEGIEPKQTLNVRGSRQRMEEESVVGKL